MRDRRCRVAAAVVGCALLALPATASAVGPRVSSPTAAKPFLDSRTAVRERAARTGNTVAAARPSVATSAARGALLRRLGSRAVLSVDPLTGTPRQLLRTDGALTGSRAGARTTIARDFIDANRVALGLSQADVDGLSLYRQASTARGLTLVHYRQLYRGIPAFDNDLRVAIDRYGRVVSVSGAPRPGLAVDSIEPALSGADAFERLQANVGVRRPVAVTSGPSGARHTTRFASKDFARLVLFGTANGARLAYHVTYRANSHALYDAVVDADSGAILYRQNLVKDASPRGGLSESPGRERRRGRRPRGLRPRGDRHQPERRLLARLVRRRRRRRGRPGRGGHPHRRRLRLPVHPVRGRRLHLGRALRVGSRGPHLVGDQPGAERRPGLLSGVAVP